MRVSALRIAEPLVASALVEHAKERRLHLFWDLGDLVEEEPRAAPMSPSDSGMLGFGQFFTVAPSRAIALGCVDEGSAVVLPLEGIVTRR